jgi:hypothetical protein
LDTGLDPATRYNYRADIFAGATQLKYAATVNPISYPSTAYATLRDYGNAVLAYSTDNTVATLEVLQSTAANKDQYPVLKNANLYTFNTNAQPVLLGTIRYQGSEATVAAVGIAPIDAYSYYVPLSASALETLRRLGNSYTLVTENATDGSLSTVTGGTGPYTVTPTLSVYSQLSSATKSVVKSTDNTTAGVVTFGTTENAFLPTTVIYYRVGTAAANYEFKVVGTIASRAPSAGTTEGTGTAAVTIAGDTYYASIQDWAILVNKTNETLYIRDLSAVPGATLSTVYQSIGTVNFN